MSEGVSTLSTESLRRFQSLQAEAVSAVTERFLAAHGPAYAQFSQRGHDESREDLAFHLEFLRPVLEFGLLQPMVDYLCWLSSVLAARGIATEHLALSLDWLAEYFVSHMTTADGAVVAAALSAARKKFLKQVSEPPLPLPLPSPWPEVAEFVDTLLAGNTRAALEIMARCLDRGVSLVEVELHIIQPALYNIGEQWQDNKVSVAREHMATAIVQAVMTMGLERSSLPESIGKKVMLACVEGNIHMVGLRMVADAFQLAGWEVQYLGANVPTAALLQQVAEWKPDLVGLSLSFPQQLKVVRSAIAQMSDLFGEARPPVVIGGLAINRLNALAGLAGADGFSTDARMAVDYANRIISGGASLR